MKDLQHPSVDTTLDVSQPPETPTARIHQAGTLRYTTKGLCVLFLWLLWGDFAFTFFESIFGRFIPLYLKDLKASNALIGLMTGSIAGAVNILFLPNISQWSDRYRSKWGRRIPFLYVVAPLTTLCLVMVGLAPEIAGWFCSHVLVRFMKVTSTNTVVLVLLCTCVVSFHFFNMVLVNAYNWLLRDVVPQELMARFISWFRIVGTVASFAFLWYVFPYVMSHRAIVFIGIGSFYLISFLLMCINVKEGEYPPPAPISERPGLLKSFGLYFRECLDVDLYRNFIVAYVLTVLAGSCAGPFTILFARETLRLNMDDMGKVFAFGAAVSAIAYFPMGWLCDRVSPIRVSIASLVCFVFLALYAATLLEGKVAYFVYTAFLSLPAVGWGLGIMTTTMVLFPKERFGQFSSALNVFGCGGTILGNYAIGKFMDLAHSNYRMAYVWCIVLYVIAIYPMVLVYKGWKKHGGPGNYVAPLPKTIG
ncbi:MAG: MFS transporter [Chthoniobacteraceae bacterium]